MEDNATMTVSELEQWTKDHVDQLRQGFLALLINDTAPMRMLDLIADWKGMRRRLVEVLDYPSLSYAVYQEVSDTLQGLKLKP